MTGWILTCNPSVFDLEAYRRDGHTPDSWSVHRYRGQLAPGDPFALWVTGADGGLVAHGRITGAPWFGPPSDGGYWREDPGERWYVPLAVDRWLEGVVPRSRIAEDPRVAKTTIFTQPFAGNPHRLADAQWEAVSELMSQTSGGAPGRGPKPGEEIHRAELHRRDGGEGKGGIGSTTRPAPQVSVGTNYRPADEDVTPEASEAPSGPDPDLSGRNLRTHRRLQNDLAAAAQAQGFKVLSPAAADPTSTWHGETGATG
ncbi:hypothetical protein [Streptomyces sp. NPDC004134]|uniref:hypothetical protein n=1 Tax=Streptomyces sp. NPDC004134 TaxID=3364691 RepID=UPI0036C96068